MMRQLLAAAGVVLAGFLMAPAGAAAEEPAAAPPLVTVRFATLGTANVFTDMALERGTYRRHGIDLQVLYFTRGPHDALAGVIGGGVDMGSFGSPILTGLAFGLPIKIVGSPPEKRIGFELVARTGLKAVQDLKGKVVYASGLGTGPNQALVRILQGNGVRPEDVKIVSASGDAELILRSGKVDAVITSGLTRYKLEQDGIGTLVALSRDYYGHYQHSFVFATNDFIAHHPETVRNYFAAAREGYDYARSHLDEVVDYTLKRVKLERALVAQYYRDLVQDWDLSFTVDVDGTANAVSILREMKEIKPGAQFDPKTWLDQRFIN